MLKEDIMANAKADDDTVTAGCSLVLCLILAIAFSIIFSIRNCSERIAEKFTPAITMCNPLLTAQYPTLNEKNAACLYFPKEITLIGFNGEKIKKRKADFGAKFGAVFVPPGKHTLQIYVSTPKKYPAFFDKLPFFGGDNIFPSIIENDNTYGNAEITEYFFKGSYYLLDNKFIDKREYSITYVEKMNLDVRIKSSKKPIKKPVNNIPPTKAEIFLKVVLLLFPLVLIIVLISDRWHGSDRHRKYY